MRIRYRRLKIAMAKSDHTDEEWEEIRGFFGTCLSCRGESGFPILEADHIIPIYQGGCNGIRNIQPLCAKCNASKGPDNRDLRIIYCREQGINFPEKWRGDLCENEDCDMLEVCSIRDAVEGGLQ